MPIDPNDPLTDLPPLDIASMLPPPPQQAAPPQQSGSGNKKGLSLNLALAALMPLAAKRGGPMAVSGLLRGIQRAQAESQAQQQQQFQNNRLTQGDQRAQEALDQARWNQQQTVAGSILREASGALAGVESPDAVGPLLALYKQRLANAGFRDTGVLDRYAQSIAAPDKILRRKVEKVIAKTKPEVLDAYVQSRASLKTDDGQVIPFDVWSQHLASGVDPQTGKPIITVAPPPKPEPAERAKSIEQQYLDAIQSGDTALAAQIKQAANIRDNPPAPKPAGSDGLSPRAQQQVSAQARNYDTNQVVKNTQTMSEAASFASSLDPNTKNPADDQALIYAFAKAMDPNSVVREGEYATVQRYAQSWADSFGFNAARIFSNTAFLTPQARQNMKRTIQARFRAAQGQYRVVRDSYVKKINKITGMNDGEDWLTDYGGAFPADETQSTATGRATVTPAAPSRTGGAGPVGVVVNPFRPN